jgi:hypothetical protein
MEERRLLIRRIQKAERRMAAGYNPPKGMEPEFERGRRLSHRLDEILLALHPSKETYEHSRTYGEAQV